MRRILTPLTEDRHLDGDTGEDRGGGGKSGKELGHGGGGRRRGGVRLLGWIGYDE